MVIERETEIDRSLFEDDVNRNDETLMDRVGFPSSEGRSIDNTDCCDTAIERERERREKTRWREELRRKKQHEQH
ncbi:hypothetical protein WN51_10857 [Melipona quadrifasciata]|uniref:Uncharacterized protein n=1 Tax=Melipona quadrifasciata TaxID=166423 RepID=A0A0N0U687_9HYME|nr:hypothetical protein WN51_10857 [Melipona quadrifasciata]